MEEKKTYYMQDLYDQSIEDLQHRLKESGYGINDQFGRDYIDDLIPEIADNNIPIYTYDLLQYASHNFELNDPNEELCTEYPSVTQIIQANIYQWLSEHLYNHIENTIQVYKKRKTEGEK